MVVDRGPRGRALAPDQEPPPCPVRRRGRRDRDRSARRVETGARRHGCRGAGRLGAAARLQPLLLRPPRRTPPTASDPHRDQLHQGPGPRVRPRPGPPGPGSDGPPRRARPVGGPQDRAVGGDRDRGRFGAHDPRQRHLHLRRPVRGGVTRRAVRVDRGAHAARLGTLPPGGDRAAPGTRHRPRCGHRSAVGGASRPPPRGVPPVRQRDDRPVRAVGPHPVPGVVARTGRRPADVPRARPARGGDLEPPRRRAAPGGRDRSRPSDAGPAGPVAGRTRRRRGRRDVRARDGRRRRRPRPRRTPVVAQLARRGPRLALVHGLAHLGLRPGGARRRWSGVLPRRAHLRRHRRLGSGRGLAGLGPVRSQRGVGLVHTGAPDGRCDCSRSPRRRWTCRRRRPPVPCSGPNRRVPRVRAAPTATSTRSAVLVDHDEAHLDHRARA